MFDELFFMEMGEQYDRLCEENEKLKEENKKLRNDYYSAIDRLADVTEAYNKLSEELKYLRTGLNAIIRFMCR